jgi:UDP-4-amino-4,6-dideoxy-N-acetyl-beta-L-altrosamine N-acetyltransferase
MLINKEYKYNSGNLEFVNYINLSNEDLLTILEYRNHVEVREMMSNPKEILVCEHFEYVEKLKLDVNNFYWIVKKKDKLIGAIYLNNVNYDKRSAFWGVFLNPNYIGTGVGVEVEFEGMKVFFKEFVFNYIKAEVLNKNIDSHSIQTKFNFMEVENNINSVMYELTREDWLRLPETYKEFKRQNILR